MSNLDKWRVLENGVRVPPLETDSVVEPTMVTIEFVPEEDDVDMEEEERIDSWWRRFWETISGRS